MYNSEFLHFYINKICPYINTMEKSIYEIQKENVIIDHNSILLITNPSFELVDLASKSYMSKIIN